MLCAMLMYIRAVILLTYILADNLDHSDHLHLSIILSIKMKYLYRLIMFIEESYHGLF